MRRAAPRRHDLVPLDAAARAIAADGGRGLATCHVSSAETAPALSLDSLVD